MQLTPHFSLAEMSVSQFATRHGINNTPPPAAQKALTLLCKNILEPLRARAGKAVTVTSGFRCPRVNVGIGGSSSSQHCAGEAADITIVRVNPYTVCKMIIDAGLPFDQLILEFGEWTHVSYNSNGPQRGQVLTARRRSDGSVEYVPGLHR